MRNNLANSITISRILCSGCLLFCPVPSVYFYGLYLFCGFTDMVDGTVARKTKSAGAFGARLDTVADFVFFAVCFVKIYPVLHAPTWLWLWIMVIAIVKVGNAVWLFLCDRQLVSVHSGLNKAAGCLLFLFPLTLGRIPFPDSGAVICSLATVSAIHEVWHSRMARQSIAPKGLGCAHPGACGKEKNPV